MAFYAEVINAEKPEGKLRILQKIIDNEEIFILTRVSKKMTVEEIMEIGYFAQVCDPFENERLNEENDNQIDDGLIKTMYLEGKTYKTIGETLGISYQTVVRHLAKMGMVKNYC